MSGLRTDLVDRDQRMLQMMKLGRPVRIIAALEGLEHDYARKICVRLAKDHGLQYVPDNKLVRAEIPPVGITDSSRNLRRYLADKLWELGDDPRATAKQIGMTLRCQKYARQRPFNHNWTLSQIERLAEALGSDFATLMRGASLAGVFHPCSPVQHPQE